MTVVLHTFAAVPSLPAEVNTLQAWGLQGVPFTH